MTILKNNAEGGTLDTQITTSNTGGASGTAFSTVSGTGITFSDNATRGTLSYDVSVGSSTRYADLVAASASGSIGFRTYFYVPASVSSDITIFTLMNGTSYTGAIRFAITDTAGAYAGYPVVLTGGSGTSNGTFQGYAMTASLTTSTWYRLEFRYNKSVNTWYTALYTGSGGDSTTPVATNSGSFTGATTYDRVRIGKLGTTNSAGSFAVSVDDIALQDGSANVIGPEVGGGTTTVEANPVSTSWDVRELVSDTQATEWNILSGISDTQDTSWGVRTVVSASTASTTWAATSKVADSAVSTTFDVRSLVQDTQSTTYSVRESVSDAQSTDYRVLVSVSSTQSTLWDVAGATTQVEASIGTTYSVLALVSDTQETTYGVRASVADVQDTLWGVREKVSGSADASWGVRTTVSDSQATEYAVRTTVLDTLSTQWNVSAPAITYTSSAEGGVGGTVVTTDNSGVAGDAFTVITGTTFYNTVQGGANGTSTSYQVTTGTGSQSVGWTTTGGTQAALRSYIYMTAYPTTTNYIHRFASATNTSLGWSGISTTGLLASRFEGSGSTTNASGTIPLNTWVRIETLIDTVAGTATSAWYIGSSTTPGGIATDTDTPNSTPVTRGEFGKLLSTANSAMYFDDLAFRINTSAFIGPAGGVVEATPVSTTWSISAKVADAQTSEWAVREYASVSSASTQWDVRQKASDSLSSEWGIRTIMAAASESTFWDVRTVVPFGSVNTGWSVLQIIDLEASVYDVWDVVGKIDTSIATRWRVGGRYNVYRVKGSAGSARASSSLSSNTSNAIIGSTVSTSALPDSAMESTLGGSSTKVPMNPYELAEG